MEEEEGGGEDEQGEAGDRLEGSTVLYLRVRELKYYQPLECFVAYKAW